jgi:hypothetical protein
MDNHRFDQNPKRLRKKWNTKWSRYFRVESALLAKRSAEDISPLNDYSS